MKIDIDGLFGERVHKGEALVYQAGDGSASVHVVHKTAEGESVIIYAKRISVPKRSGYKSAMERLIGEVESCEEMRDGNFDIAHAEVYLGLVGELAVSARQQYHTELGSDKKITKALLRSVIADGLMTADDSQIPEHYALYNEYINTVRLNGYRTRAPLGKVAHTVDVEVVRNFTEPGVWDATYVLLERTYHRTIHTTHLAHLADIQHYSDVVEIFTPVHFTQNINGIIKDMTTENTIPASGQTHSIRDVQIDRPTHVSKRKRRSPEGVRRGGAPGVPQRRARRSSRGLSVMMWLLSALFLVGASALALTIVFSETTITVTPKVTRASFSDALYTAVKDGSGASATSTESADGADTKPNNTIAYRTVSWETKESVELEPTGREVVKERASGVITVYNNYTERPQRLIKNTRFETSDGHVYRVRHSITVPGKSGGKPGELKVRVYADEPGDDYNISSGDLTLPGLKSIPDMYTTIYAKITEPMTGGFSGERAVVSEEQKAQAIKKLKDKIRERVLSEASGRISDDARYFSDGVYIVYDSPREEEVSGKVRISVGANVRVLTVNKRDFAKMLSRDVAGNPESGYPEIQDIDALTITLEERTQDDETETVKMIVNGKARFVWRFNEENLKADLAGKPREALKTVLKGYPMIVKAEAMVRPFWRRNFPKNVNDINIVTATDDATSKK